MKTTKGIVLKKTAFGESDLILSVLSLDGEKLKLFARGARNSKKRFGGGVLEPTHYISMTFKEKEDGLSTLNEAHLIEGFSSLRSDYDKITLALEFVSSIDKLSLEGMIDAKPLFDLLGNALQAAQICKDLRVLQTQFQLKLLYYQGVLPGLSGAEVFLKSAIRDVNDIQAEEDQISLLQVQSSLLLKSYLNP